ncbi:MAG: HD-GYP domain-containing protein [Geobacter sp.]|nr:HD-GYP domain-containing protein [Geobacter sp.]
MTTDSLKQNLTMAVAQRLASIFAGLIRSTTLYPPGNPALTRPLNDLHGMITAYLKGTGSIRIGLSDEILFVEEHLFVTAPAPVEELANIFASRKIDAVIITQGVGAEEIFTLAKLFADRTLSTQALIATLEDNGISHIMVISEEDNEERLIHEAGNAYQVALESIRTAFSDIEEHRIPSSERLLAATRQFSEIAVQDPLVISSLAMIKDYDNYTFNHSVNVGVIAMALAAHLKFDKQTVEIAGMAGFLHDIGKTMVSKSIINKPGKLTSVEFDEIKKHPEDGVKIIDKMAGLSPDVANAVLGHHLRYNKKGYPEWAQNRDVGVMSRIIAIADCFDACTTLRVYQQPMPPATAISRMKELAGEFLDPDLVKSFATMMGKYPPGTLVRLNTNEIALVWKSSSINPDAPLVMVIFDSDGVKVAKPVTEKLLERGGGTQTIVGVVDPLKKGIEVGDYFKLA